MFVRLFPTERAAALQQWFDVVQAVLAGCQYGRVATRDDAVAVWTTAACPDCLAQLDDGLSALLRERSGGAAIDLVDAVQAAVSPQDGPFLHWLGVLPAGRRQGSGRALLDELGTPAWTTTANPDAVPFYRACGWTAVAERAVPGHPALTCWTLRTG